MGNKIAKEIADILKETGELIRKSPEEEAIVLRQNIRKIEKLSEESDNRHLVYLSYFLGLYVDDVWSNFAVDSSYRGEIQDEDVRRVISQIGNELIRIGKCLMTEDYYGCYNGYLDLVYIYLKDVENIKMRL